MKRIISLLIILVLILSVISCAKKEEPKQEEVKEEVKEEPKQEEVKEEVKEEKKEEVKPKNEVKNIFTKHPMVIMLDNHWAARPQSGISRAKIIYEMLAEGRITRIMMLTDDEEGIVGPVRSARPYFIRAMQEYKGMYCHVGGSTEALNILRRDGLNDMDQFWIGSRAYWRARHRKMPHNMYSDLGKLYKVARNKGYKVDLESDFEFPFKTYTSFVELKGGKEASSVNYSYTPRSWSGAYQYNITYKYNKEKNIYEKFYAKTKLIDEKTKKPLEISNLIIQIAPHRVHSNGKHKIIGTVGKGKGYYLTGGKYTELTWEKESKYAKTKFMIDGKELVVNPGLTFVNVIEKRMEVKFDK